MAKYKELYEIARSLASETDGFLDTKGPGVGNKVNKLVFFTKPGGFKKCNQPGRMAVREWLLSSNQIDIEIMELYASDQSRKAGA